MVGSELKVAIVHDFLMQYGGAERVIEALHRIFPNAPIHALVIRRENLPDSWRDFDLRPHPRLLWLSRWGALHKALFFIYPRFVENWDFSGYDLVVSSSHSFVHGVNVRADARHVCYCYAPMRFVWMQKSNYLAKIPALLRPWYRRLIARLRQWDLSAAKKPKTYVAISDFTARKIREAYDATASIVFPPVALGPQSLSSATADYFLVVSRLVLPHKRVDLAIRAANTMRLPLKIVGEGSDRRAFEKIAGPTVEFLGRVSDDGLKALYQNCRGLILCWEEEFGIAPVEANRFGKPIIAFRGGGALDTQVEDKTCIFFDHLEESSLCQALRKFEGATFDPKLIQAHASRFSFENFRDQLAAICQISPARPHARA